MSQKLLHGQGQDDTTGLIAGIATSQSQVYDEDIKEEKPTKRSGSVYSCNSDKVACDNRLAKIRESKEEAIKISFENVRYTVTVNSSAEEIA